MSFFSNLFKRNSQSSTTTPDFPPELEKLFDLNEAFKLQLSMPEYISKKAYQDLKKNFQNLEKHFSPIIQGELLRDYCDKYSVDFTKTLSAFNRLHQMDYIVDEHNEQYIIQQKELQKDYLDNILKEIDENIILDENQREVVLSDEDYSLVIAGAGAGKTTTVAAKVKYLVDKKEIKPSQILVISFTNKAVDELKERINKNLAIDCPISTFHSAGNAILRKNEEFARTIASPNTMYYVLQDYFKTSVLKNDRMVHNIILFFASYLNVPPTGEDLKEFFRAVSTGRYETLRSNLGEYIEEVVNHRTKKTHTITNELLRSQEEVQIANFLYLNQIDYKYEELYPFRIPNSKKVYTPDFKIFQDDRSAYIEHFGITEDGKNNRYTQEQLDFYKKSIQDKIKLHQEHGTTLIYTFSQYNDNRSLTEHLKEELLLHGFKLYPRSQAEVLEKLVHSEQSSYVHHLVHLIRQFLSNFKANAYTLDDFSRMINSTSSVRNKLFLEICEACYLEYQQYLHENNVLDFDDMINESAKILREVQEMKKVLDFKYIIVDEYQDISRQRYDLTSELSKVTDAKIIAVGDDWQSIYAFSGSDIELFTKFQEKTGYAKVMQIVNTYRNAQEVIDIAGNFIQKNPAQITKRLKSPKNISDPIIIYTYNPSPKKSNALSTRSGANYAMAQAVERAIEQIILYNETENKPTDSSILLIGRFNFDGDHLEKSGLFEFHRHRSKIRSVKYPRLNITFMTAHSSKGLGYDNVIIINGKNEQYGFPSKIKDDPVLNFVTKRDLAIEHAEERRLFYVAMTRTKNRIFCIAPEKNPSEFLLEIKKNYNAVVLKGDWNEEYIDQNKNQKYCPICGFPLQYRYKKSIGLPLFICTNEPEICGFLSNDLKGGKMSIQKCDLCVDGYLIAKPPGEKTKDHFLGCTNYSKDGKGCNNTLSKTEYYHIHNLTDDILQNQNLELYNDAGEKVQQNAYPADHKALSTDYMDFHTKEETLRRHSQPSVRKSKLNEIYYKEENLLRLIGIILECVREISEIHFFGITMITAVLHSSKNKKIQQYKLQNLSSFGRLEKIEKEITLTTLRWLVENGYLRQREGMYPVLHMTHRGNHYQNIITNRELQDLLKNLEQQMSSIDKKD